MENNEWIAKSINCVTNSGRFSSDRTVNEYAEEIWEVQELSIPKGSATPIERIKSFPNITKEEKMREKMNTT